MAHDDRYGRNDRNRDYERGRERWRGDDRRQDDDRGFFDRAADEMRAWFGDDEADRRRHRDHDGYHFHGAPESDMPGWDRPGDGYNARSGSYYGGPGGRTAGRDVGRTGGDHYGARTSSGQGQGGYGAYGGGMSTRSAPDRNARQGGGHLYDENYHNWRAEQMSRFDQEYEEFRRHRHERFAGEFEEWRNNRNTQAGAVATGAQWATKIREHQEVLGSDGEHVGVVDHVDGDRIKLAKSGGDGTHHYLPLTAVISVDNAVRLNVPAADARRQWRGGSGL